MPFSGLQSLMIKIGHGGLERVSNLEKDPNDIDSTPCTVSQHTIKFY